MKNERDVKLGLCSRTGNPCECESGKGCTRARKHKSMDEATKEALLWARAADIGLETALADIDLTLERLPFKGSRHPAPELRETRRLIEAARTLLADAIDTPTHEADK